MAVIGMERKDMNNFYCLYFNFVNVDTPITVTKSQFNNIIAKITNVYPIYKQEEESLGIRQTIYFYLDSNMMRHDVGFISHYE